MREELEAAARRLTARLRGGEEFRASFRGEESDFVRFNRGRVRQAGTVAQRELTVELVRGRRHAAVRLTLSGDADLDGPRLDAALARLRETCAEVPEDPFLMLAGEPRSSEQAIPGALPARDEVLAAARRAGESRDLVGLFSAGPIHVGFADSRAQRNWHSVSCFAVDWSFHGEGAKAVKVVYAGTEWSAAELARRADRAALELELLARRPRRLAPGGVRAYLAPPAMHELIGLLSWGGFGLRAHRTKTTPLLAMIERGARLGAAVTLVEDIASGLAPRFQETGFARPARVPLVEAGALVGALVAPESAAEYGVATNGASAGESPQALDMAAGALPAADALEALDTGLAIGALHYLNYSDRCAGRITGLTRFGTFWVEGGEIVAPVDAMRFDDTIYRLLGSNLVALTGERDWLVDPHSYERRSIEGARLPGALIDDFRLTL